MTERVTFVLGNIDSRLAVVEIVGVRFPVLPQRPTNLVRLFAKEEVGGKTLGIGQREVDGEIKNIAWWADEMEVIRIDVQWRDALDTCTVEVTDEMLARFAD